MAAGPQVALKAGALAQLKAQELCKTVGQAEAATNRLGIEVKTSNKSLIKSVAKTAPSMVGKNKVVFKEGAALPEMNGAVIFSNSWTEESAPAGIYKLPQAEGQGFTLRGLSEGTNAVQIDEYVYSCAELSIWGFFLGISVEVIDPATWEVVATKSLSSKEYRIIDGAYDPTTGTTYAINYDASGSALQLVKLTASDETGYAVTPIAALEGVWNSLAVAPDGQMYGIAKNNDVQYLYKIDKTNGQITEVGPTGILSQYMSSSEIDPKTGKMFWTVSTDDAGYLAEVNLATGAATPLVNFADGEEVTSLMFPIPLADENAPAAATDLVATFTEGSLSGTVAFKAPATLFNGNAATGEVTYTVYANDVVAATGTTTYGAQVSTEYTATAAGKYTFVVVMTNAAGKGPKAKTSLFVGNGIPKAPATATLAYADGKMNLTWDAVTESANGGYINPSAVTYTINRVVNGGEPVQVVADLAATTYSETVTTPENLTSYAYTIVANYAGATSTVTKTNSVMLGEAGLPYTQDFSGDASMQSMVVVDVNADGRTWTRQNAGTTAEPDYAARYQYHGKNAGDDWMFTPEFTMEAGKAYPVKFLVFGNSTSYKEKIEVKAGQGLTPEAMTLTLLEATEIQCKGKANAIEYTVYLTPATSGKYSVGFHAISDADQFYLYVDDITISEGIAATAPNQPTLATTPDANGDYKVTVTATAPTVDFAGNPVVGLTKMEISRDGNLVKTFDAPVAGQDYTFVDEMTAGGTVTYTAVAYNADGKGKPVTKTQFVGTDKPASPTNVTIAETATLGEVTLTWDAVTTDYNGNSINPAKVTYTIAEQGTSGWVAKFEGLTETSKTFMALENPEEQDFASFAVFAVTEGGNSGSISDMIPVGAPYTSMFESFPNQTLSYILGMQRLSGTDATWSLAGDDLCPSSDGDNGFVAHKSNQLGGSSAIFTGKINLAGMTNPGVTFATYNIIGEDSTKVDLNEYVVAAKAIEDTTWTTLKQGTVTELGAPNQWHKVTASLEAFAGKTVQVRIACATKVYAYTFVDDIRITSLVDQDLAAGKITAPAKAKCGTEFPVSVEVKNDGQLASPIVLVDLFANGKKVATKEVASIESGKKTTVDFTATMSALATEAMELYAVINFTADQAPANNTTAKVTVAPIVSTLPTPTELAATLESNGVKLTWNEPNLEGGAAEEVTENFEEAESWAQEFEGWTFVDGDNSPVGGFQGKNIPGITPGTTTASFFVFDASDAATWNATFAGHSGTKYLAALFRYDDGTTEDWAITPELSGTAQTVSFYAKSYSASYPEKIALYYSTTGTAPADFVEVVAAAVVPGEWTLYTADLPAGAKYFGIKSCATGSFMLMVDDVTFSKGSSTANLSLTGYNVYRNGEKINEALVEEVEYLDAAGTAEHTYNVTAVYAEKGESAGSNSAKATNSGIADASKAVKVASAKGLVLVSGAEGKSVQVANIEGKTIFSGKGNAKVAVAAGVYVVKVDNKVYKLLVK